MGSIPYILVVLSIPPPSKSCGHLAHSDFDRGQVDHCPEALIGLFVAGGDTPECLEFAEEVFDEVAPTVRMKVAVDLLCPVRFGRYHSDRAPVVEFRAQPVRIERFVT